MFVFFRLVMVFILWLVMVSMLILILSLLRSNLVMVNWDLEFFFRVKILLIFGLVLLFFLMFIVLNL